jgi:hypothetical protein
VVRLYLEGTNFRCIGRLFSVNHQSVVNWVNSYHASLPAAEHSVATPETLEMDELFTFVGSKKTQAYVVTLVDRASRCIHALTRAVDLFVRCYNARQIRKHKVPEVPRAAYSYDLDTPRKRTILTPQNPAC